MVNRIIRFVDWLVGPVPNFFFIGGLMNLFAGMTAESWGAVNIVTGLFSFALYANNVESGTTSILNSRF